MRWRQFTRAFTRLNHARTISTSTLFPRSNLHFHPQRRSFHYVDGKFVSRETPLESQVKPDWNEAIDKIMAHQELIQLQQFLGLVEPDGGKPVEDVVFVCIDIEAFEFKQEIITEIGMLKAIACI